jgi:hypothetical protein
MKLITKIWPNPLHCFLLPLFFILHNCIDFYGLIDIGGLKTDFLLWLLAPSILFSCFYFLLRDSSKAGLLTTLLLFFYFFGAALQQFLNQLPAVAGLFKQSLFLFLLFLLLLFVIVWIVSKKRRIDQRVHLYLSVCLLLFIAYDLGLFLSSGNNQTKNLLIPQNTFKLQPVDTTGQREKPDIYFFIFDMHGSSNSFQKLFGYKNQLLDSSLTQNGFLVSANSISASNYTLTSIASLFSMELLPFNNEEKLSFKEMYRARNSIAHNPLTPFLKEQGYAVINASSFPLFEKDTGWLYHSGWGNPNELIRNQTLLSHILKSSGWMLEKYLPSIVQPAEYLVYKDDLSTINQSIKKVEQAINSKDTVTPKFIYSHLFIPHEPYKYDSSGSILPYSREMYRTKTSEQYFIQQLIYCRKLILQLATDIQKKNARPAVIIFQGDHGFRVNQKSEKANEVFSVLNAFYFPEKNNLQLTDSFYTPNTFRVLLNHYFNQQLPMLPSKTTMIKL